jgi:hypothetical protein
LLAFLHQDDPLPRQLRPLLCEQGRFPSRRTWERRLVALPPSLPALIGYCGRHLVVLLQPWARHGRAVAFDRPPLETGGASGTTSIESKVFALIARLIRKRAGASRGGTAGGMAGNSISP